MQIVRDLAGYSLGRSDLVRRAMAKKKHSVMEAERAVFVNGAVDENGEVLISGCVRNGVPEDVANGIYDEMISFASYAFNKSHAAAYAVVCMETAWLKYHHMVPFMAAMLNSVFNNSAKIAGYIQYCRGRGIKVLPPDVNNSMWKFTVKKQEDGSLAIVFGLGAVKNVGEAAVASIIRERENGAYRDIFDFCERVDTTAVSKRVVESLICCGAFDATGAQRSQMLAVYEREMDANASRRKQNVAGQLSLMDLLMGGDEPVISHVLPPMPPEDQKRRLVMEKEYTGLYITGHPLDSERAVMEKIGFSTADLQDLDSRDDHGLSLDGAQVDMGGILVECHGKATKKGAYMGFCTLEDLTGQIDCLVFPKVFEKYQLMLNADDMVVLSGKLSIREEDSPKLLVDTVCPLEDWKPTAVRHHAAPPLQPKPAAPKAKPAPALTDAQLAKAAPKRLYLRLERAAMSRASAVLALYQGSIPVYMYIQSENMTLLAPKTAWCSGDPACLKRLEEALGQGNVKMIES